jgi:hypothetical protein
MGPLTRAGGAVGLTALTVACLARAIKGEGADLEFLTKCPGLPRRWRLTGKR